MPRNRSTRRWRGFSPISPGNFSEAYYGEPLPLDVAERALARLTELVEKGVKANAAGLPQQMALLNEIGLMELN